MEAGQTVRQRAPVIEGPIVDTRYNREARGLEHLVSFVDAEGEQHQRWFLESQLEVMEAQA